MINGDQLGSVGYVYIGTPYKQMDCQKFVERCLADCGLRMDLAGSNAWYREVMAHGWTGTPEECVQKYGKVPAGAFLFILLQDGREPAKYKGDGIGNASHIGICTGTTGQGAIHSSSSRGMVCESKFQGKTIPNGGWNRVGLYDKVEYNTPPPRDDPAPALPVLRKGSKGDAVRDVQRDLMQLGYDLDPWGDDGDFGSKTEAAVKEFQRDHGLQADGIVGPATYAALEEAMAEVPGVRYTVTIVHLTAEEADEIITIYGGEKSAEG